jgi:N-acetylglucosaminyl-diphospho-decaprenol L-rhamnosyltransferase
MAEPKISVVTVSWNTGPLLKECLTSVLAAPGVHELVLVNHQNPPEINAELRAMAAENSKLVLIETGANLGFSKGCNIGAEQASGDYVLFLNPDTVLGPGVASRFKESASILTRRPWLIGGRILNRDGSEQRGARRGELTPWIAVVSFLGLHRIFPGLRGIHREAEKEVGALHPVPTVSGAAMMMRRDDYLEMGGLDERYFLHVEDIDICRAVRESGGQVWFEPRANILHYGRTSRISPLTVETHKAAGFVKYFWKFYPGPLERLLTVMLIPMIYGGLWSRVVVLSVRAQTRAFIHRLHVRKRYDRRKRARDRRH